MNRSNDLFGAAMMRIGPRWKSANAQVAVPGHAMSDLPTGEERVALSQRGLSKSETFHRTTQAEL